MLQESLISPNQDRDQPTFSFGELLINGQLTEEQKLNLKKLKPVIKVVKEIVKQKKDRPDFFACLGQIKVRFSKTAESLFLHIEGRDQIEILPYLSSDYFEIRSPDNPKQNEFFITRTGSLYKAISDRL